jgi:hypothetical protein
VPQTAHTKIATFTDDAAVMAVGENIEEATDKLQKTINLVNFWRKQWRIIWTRLNQLM